MQLFSRGATSAAMADYTIRDAREEDAGQIAAIYAHHVLHGSASYDTEAPPEAAFREKIRWVVGSGWPFLVAEWDGEILGYAYATQFRDRAAYRWTAEDSIYVRADSVGQGVGRTLLKELLEHHIREEESAIWRHMRDNYSEEQRMEIDREFMTMKKKVKVS